VAPRKRNLYRRETVKSLTPFSTPTRLPRRPQEPQEREEAIREAAEKARAVGNEKRVPPFARNKKK
jgi:hypothetical protein